MSHTATVPDLDILIPAKNEAKTLPELIQRIDRALASHSLSYRVILIDDRSTDATPQVVKDLSIKYPIVYKLKQGKTGKAFSIFEGLSASTAPILTMIDADLEYPPEALPSMYRQLVSNSHGVVVANRRTVHKNPLFRLLSHLNKFILGWLLLGLKCDVQSGLKVFKREVLEHTDPIGVGAWSVDMPLLHTARELGWVISTVPIDFICRTVGVSKCKNEFLKAVRDIGLGALKIRLAPHRIYQIDHGLAHRGRRYITHTHLPLEHSAFITLLPWQKFLLLSALLLFITGLVVSPLTTGISIVAVLSLVYFTDMLFSLWLVYRSLYHSPELRFSPTQLADCATKLPVYTILCPLYKEAAVLPHFVSAVSRLDWPKNRLEVLLLLEEGDSDTLAAARAIQLPSCFRIVVVPHSLPKTKPKACNYGLARASGDYIVVYDAEDRPEPDQLKKAYLAFSQLPGRVACLQAKLNYYNHSQNLLTRLFTAEYSLWFDLILPGYQSINTAIPLGGTSNHFRASILKSLHGWDAFNVTEDCDLGARLFKLGYITAVIDSTTYEEANSRAGNWLRQRSRWIKGYFQTWLVHNRRPLQFIKSHGLHAFIFQLIVGGKTLFMLVNPLLWLATVSYFAFYSTVGPTIESLYPVAVFYLAGFSAVFGNFLFLYYYMIGLAKRGHWSHIKYVYLIPVYWFMVSLAAVKAFYQLVFRPHYWEKTHHGLAQTQPQAKWAWSISIRLTWRTVAIFGRIMLALAWLALQAIGLYLTRTSLPASIAVIVLTFIGFLVSSHLSVILTRSWWLVARLFSDLRGLFQRLPAGPGSSPDHLRILVFNWRDIRHKWAGGAEVYLHQLAKRWVAAGHQVTMFCGSDGSPPANEVIDGIKIIRRGGFYTLYFLAPLYYLLRFRGRFDVVIDSENGVPFFTPLFVTKPKILLIHHIHQDLFRSKLYFPMDQIALVLESFFMPLFYSRQKIVTVSQSSKQGILKLGLSQADHIDIVHPGIDPAEFTPSSKTPHPSFVYLGRIRPQKNIDVAIRAFAQVRQLHPTVTFTIAGWGEDIDSLKKLAASLRLGRSVRFLSRVTDSDRVGLLGQSWAAVQPSSFEGWGITVIEANAAGTPVIASDVAGLKDSVIPNHTGLLVPPLNPVALAAAMDRLIIDSHFRRRLAKNALTWSQQFAWDNLASQFLTVLTHSVQSARRSVLSPQPAYEQG